MFDFVKEYHKRCQRAGIDTDKLNRLSEIATVIDNVSIYANGCHIETEQLTWELLRDERDALVSEYGADEVEKRSVLTYSDWAEVKDEIEELARDREAMPPKTSWELALKFKVKHPDAANPMPGRNQPTGDCVGNGTERSLAALLLDLWDQGCNFMPRPIHPSYSYTIARMLAGSTRGAGANVSLAGRGLFQHGLLFENQDGVPQYDKDRDVSNRWGRGGWNSAEFKKMTALASPFKATIIKLPRRDNMAAINTCLDAGLKINGGFGVAPVGTRVINGVKFSTRTKPANHCMSQLGRFLDPVPGYCWANSWGAFYPGECILGTPGWATNLQPDLFAHFMDGSDCYAVRMFIGTSTGTPNWGLIA